MHTNTVTFPNGAAGLISMTSLYSVQPSCMSRIRKSGWRSELLSNWILPRSPRKVVLVIKNQLSLSVFIIRNQELEPGSCHFQTKVRKSQEKRTSLDFKQSLMNLKSCNENYMLNLRHWQQDLVILDILP